MHTITPESLIMLLFVLVLASYLGFELINKVPPTPVSYTHLTLPTNSLV